MPAGRPRKTYNRRIAEEVCARIAFSADGLHKILDDLNAEANPGLERQHWKKILTLRQIWNWLEESAEFRDNYARAREQQAEYLGDLQMAEAQNNRIGEYRKSYQEVGKDGTPRKKVEIRQDDNVARSRLICDVIDRRMKQLAPKKYRIRDSDIGNTDGPNEQLAALRQALIDGPVGDDAEPLDGEPEEKKPEEPSQPDDEEKS